MRKIVIPFLAAMALIAAFALVVFIGSFYFSQSTKVEAQSLQRFQFEAVGSWTNDGRTDRGGFGTISFKVAAICDTKNGNLIYISGGSQSAPAVVPNGCQKNPR